MAGKVELLAPAGDYEGLIGALHAGADAVYLGGDRFGARAYADNFSSGQLLDGIRYAHLFGRRIYLTINTLVKEKEFDELYSYLAPLYTVGLDGVIVQDVGVLRWVTKQFPQLPVHASTQMNITHAYGAEFLKRNGAVRIIPARELSLAELKQIRGKVDIELETFIHGAMCYCYSGQCLFSSILGARSGNRGRCAQPCRLPYRKRSGKNSGNPDCYPLSLKDMCALTILPDLIAAGITSFKIEGRMKKPEYTAGVTAVYRKYIDMFYAEGRDGYTVAEEDSYRLQSLYIRDEAGEGYYFRHNGKEMITRKEPGYEGADIALLSEVRRGFIDSPMKLAVSGYGDFTAGQPAELTVSCSGITVSAKGADLSPALKQPLNEESVAKQLKKSGNTFFVFDDLKLVLSDNIFMPVKELNELRRKALNQLEETMLRPFVRPLPPRLPRSGSDTAAATEPDTELAAKVAVSPANKSVTVPVVPTDMNPAAYTASGQPGRPELHVQVTTAEQWKSAGRHRIKRIYIDIDIWENQANLPKPDGTEWFAVLPRIFRARSEQYLENYASILHGNLCDGVLIQNIESYQWLRSVGYSGRIVTDHSLYIWNKASWQFWREHASECYLPIELNRYEINDFVSQCSEPSQGVPAAISMMVYGRIPMMISANCIWKTGQAGKTGQAEKTGPVCQYGQDSQTGHVSQTRQGGPSGQAAPDHKTDILPLTDRYGKQFWVCKKCRHCYNIIYNTVPLSLHDIVSQGTLSRILSSGSDTSVDLSMNLRLDFTTETGKETGDIIAFFNNIGEYRNRNKATVRPYEEYTTGHSKRGVE